MNKINRYNRIASAPKNKSEEIISALGILEGNKILEIGVGGGFYANIFSELVKKNGRYYGIDTDETFIENLKTIGKTKLNITGIKILPNEIPDLQEKIDFVFTRNVYHHIENRRDYLKKIADIMSVKGKVVVIDYDESLSFFRLFGHYTKKALIMKEFNEAGFSITQNFKFLNKQSFLIFEKKKNRT